MRLTEAKILFADLAAEGQIKVHRHAHQGHPARQFTIVEVMSLIQGRGRLMVNNAATAQPDSFVWHCKDVMGRACELAVVFEAQADGSVIAVISAWRKMP